MSYCPNCGSPVEEGKRFCADCGQPLFEEAAVLSAPRQKLPTTRSWWKYLLFSLLTLGIYSIVVRSKLSTEINTVAAGHDSRHTLHYCLVLFVLAPLTLGIMRLVWFNSLSERIGDELALRGCNYRFSASTYWLWGFLGTLILVGPIIYTAKLLKAMNLINEDYNARG